MSAPASTDRQALAELLRPIRGTLVIACVLQAIASVAGVVPFVAVAELGRALADDPHDSDRAWTIAWIGAGSLLVRLAFVFAATALTHFADEDFQLGVRRSLAARLGRAPLGWFTERRAGEVKKALDDDVEAMHHLVGHGYLNLTASVVVPLTCLAYLARVDWLLTIATLLPSVVGLVLYAGAMRSHAGHLAEYDRALTRVNGSSVEFAQGIAVVKTFGQTGRAHARFQREATAFIDFFWSFARGMLRKSAVSDLLLSPVTTLLVVLAGGTALVAGDHLEAVDVLPFALLGLAVGAPFLTLSYAQQDLMTARQAAGRVHALLQTETLTAPATAPAPAAEPQRPVVRYENVSFGYRADRDVLHGIDLVLEPGRLTALVGASGSGKSTIARLLPRFWDPGTGRITLDGIDIRDLAGPELYRHVGFVFQETSLLRTSIRDNIRLGRPDAADDEIRAAARSAQIDDCLTRLPRGYDSIVGEDALLSGGEGQRVAIARMLLADTPILVMDEATAFADPESEAAIQDALAELACGRTVLVVAHRLRTITEADEICVLDAGRIVERGRHNDLLAADGRYAAMWRTQEHLAVSAPDLVPGPDPESTPGLDLRSTR
ncbi:ABC transporter ATP-binding protein [Streptomyces sp. SID3343]|uniref:ABC transporter ATP-binding protein n=1 Tax=Streptomyces sp. SID3343 TaxID=2690260 RepID=UPI001368FF19|nr:ABC transporter ATP-binding protein [Streptomyces sp. SID3343]MYW00076.1 ATP-binding cassette domain-containing protein [Streptomyces sp. SID3343]